VPSALAFERDDPFANSCCKVLLFHVQARGSVAQSSIFERSEGIHILLLKSTSHGSNIAARTQIDKPVQENNTVSCSSMHWVLVAWGAICNTRTRI